ncbi:MAG: transketolase [Parcubacteria group bacterium]|nr:transketolase [Parcubacteria group bacterium]
MTEEERQKIEDLAKEARAEILKMICRADSGHPGGSLSIVDVLAVLYGLKLRHRPAEPKWPERDRFVLSKGHAAPALYATLALTGYFDRKLLETLRELDSSLQGHPDMNKTPGLDFSTGSLGQGLSVGCGMALAAQIDDQKHQTYVFVGDGELQEGQNWEALMFANQHKLSNLTLIVDDNGMQLEGPTENITDLGDIGEKLTNFGWNVLEIDGHNLEQIEEAIESAQSSREPTAVVANTVKGKGISFIETANEYHGKPLSERELLKSLKELKK